MANRKHVALILVEGETEEEFYKNICNKKFRRIPKKIKNLKGNFNINKKIVDKAYKYSIDNPNDTFDVYVCIDQETLGVPAFNNKLVESELKKLENFKMLYPTIAVLMIESLFFVDINGLYKFLRAKNTLRNPKKYQNFRSLRHQDLSKLFKQFNKTYYKGIRCQNLASSLDINMIINQAKEISMFVVTILKRNHQLN